MDTTSRVVWSSTALDHMADGIVEQAILAGGLIVATVFASPCEGDPDRVALYLVGTKSESSHHGWFEGIGGANNAMRYAEDYALNIQD